MKEKFILRFESKYGKAIDFTDFIYVNDKTRTNFLKEKRISYVSQMKFDGWKLKRRLPFDFYLPDYNICIEYDGRFHFVDIYND